ncbi:UNVERIFIED_CONTAM: hypothetical protein GTU68_043161 [Idotea baltica]|nr:hypothetical protein [Idotea baltica]
MHPQKWDTNYDYNNQNVVVIGSGATAVTLVPEIAKKAKHVTMLQRSPTFIMNLPSEDVVANSMRKILPLKWAHTITRWKNILLGITLYNVSRRWPNKMRGFFKKQIKKTLGDQYEEKHFDPKYNPWDQRLCLIPDNDLFESLKDGSASIVTDTIDQFTQKGILLSSGEEIAADLIVTATGLKVQLLGGLKAFIDGKPLNTGDLKAYKGVLFSDVPNFAVAIGYTNASWTLKCELNCEFVAKLLNHMDKNNHQVITARFDAENYDVEPLLDFDANYIKRALDVLPKQGSKAPWKVHQNYVKDIIALQFGKINSKYLEFE